MHHHARHAHARRRPNRQRHGHQLELGQSNFDVDFANVSVESESRVHITATGFHQPRFSQYPAAARPAASQLSKLQPTAQSLAGYRHRDHHDHLESEQKQLAASGCAERVSAATSGERQENVHTCGHVRCVWPNDSRSVRRGMGSNSDANRIKYHQVNKPIRPGGRRGEGV